MWETQHNNADLDCFKTLSFACHSWRLKLNIRRSLVYFRMSHVCANKLDVQETDFSVTQLFYRSWNHFSRGRFTRMDGILTLWDLLIDVISFRAEQSRRTQEELRGTPSAVDKSYMHDPTWMKHTSVIPTNIDDIPSSTTNSGSSAMLYVFEDNEEVIKMIIKGRSPTMRHVPRTHRVDLDWLFDRTNLDTQDPNPLHWHQTSTRRHFDQRKLHMWWAEQSSSCVKYQPFQHLLFQEFQIW